MISAPCCTDAGSDVWRCGAVGAGVFGVDGVEMFETLEQAESLGHRVAQALRAGGARAAGG